MPRSRAPLAIASLLVLFAAASASAGTVGTFTLDNLSFISFGDDQVLALPAGSTIRFRFGEPGPNGVVPFTIEPGDVEIAPVDVPAGGTLQYSLASTASGTMRASDSGRQISFQAVVRAHLDGPKGKGSFDYAIPFNTESASASNAAGTETLGVNGMRLIEGAWYGQIVGATTNRDNAFPEPGAAVYTLLSGSFDQVP